MKNRIGGIGGVVVFAGWLLNVIEGEIPKNSI